MHRGFQLSENNGREMKPDLVERPKKRVKKGGGKVRNRARKDQRGSKKTQQGLILWKKEKYGCKSAGDKWTKPPSARKSRKKRKKNGAF